MEAPHESQRFRTGVKVRAIPVEGVSDDASLQAVFFELGFVRESSYRFKGSSGNVLRTVELPPEYGGVAYIIWHHGVKKSQ